MTILSPALLKKIEAKVDLPLFRFKRFSQGEYLLTNEVGEFVFLSEKDFLDYLQDKIQKGHKLYRVLKNKSFLKTEDYFYRLSEKYREKYTYLNWATCLHILVLTLRCNHKCRYCHAAAGDSKDSRLDMTKATAQKALDLIFASPSPYVTIELQGGEPTLNWEVLKFVVESIKKRRKTSKKNVKITLVSNFSLMDDAKARFLVKHNIGLSTSLDGPEDVHNFNRLWLDGNSFQTATKWLKKIYALLKKKEKLLAQKGEKAWITLPGPIPTITRKIFGRHKELIDLYAGLGVNHISLRPLNPIGFAQKTWETIGYTTEEFLEFYRQAMDYIIELNLKGVFLREALTLYKLGRILKSVDPAYNDDRTPCGGGIGQIAYDYNGDVYTCDEGRMLGRMGDEIFKMGNVRENTWTELIDSVACKSICSVSCADGYPGLAEHVYKPYIGACPAYNYAASKNMQPNFYESEYFKRHAGMLDYIFEKLHDKKIRKIFEGWVGGG
jgi:His-Xaa-Ser system radical SAM maturase HxsB